MRIFTDLGSRHVLSSLYKTWPGHETGSSYFLDLSTLKLPRPENGFPIPPNDLRMGYAVGNDEVYLSCGQESRQSLQSIMDDHGVRIEPGDACMDWGCTTGRVLRWFAGEAEHAEFWGLDQDERSIAWAKQNLSPPFKFCTCTAYPHLPFEDGTFKLIYGLSVFTHLENCVDLWLMEMRRVLKKGGCAVFSIHDESTVRDFMERERPSWIPPHIELSEILEHETTIVSSQDWEWTFTFFRSDYIYREWGRYLDVLEVRPFAEFYQSSVVLRKA